MRDGRRTARVVLGSLVGWVLLAGSGQACSVPVFRYALERWQADPYQAEILHRAPMTASEEALRVRLDAAESPEGNPVNLQLRTSDLEARTQATTEEGRSPSSLSAGPTLVLRYPRLSGISAPVWTGPFNEESVAAVLDSPARREIRRRLLRGDNAVWVLLESGEAEGDDSVAKKLARRLGYLAENLELQALDPDDIASGLVSVTDEELQVGFSMLRLSRGDPAEDVFVRMLLGTESDLGALREPIAFPVFGRGRVLYALVGDGISDENIDEACRFLTGPCSCQAKELNPGVDLLMAVDWDQEVKGTAIRSRELPELTGLAAFGEEAAPSEEKVASVGASSPDAGPPEVAAEKEKPRRAGVLFLAVVSAGGLLLAVALVGTALLLHRKR